MNPVNPYNIISFGGSNETCNVRKKAQIFLRFYYSRNCPNKSVLHLSRGCSKAIRNQPQGEEEIAVRRVAVQSRNYLDAISVQVEACMHNTLGCSA